MTDFVYDRSIPVVMLVFNRPDETSRVLNAVANAKPDRLYVVGDGPRQKSDEQSVYAVRKLFARLDWQCEVHTLFRDRNLGCKRSVETGLDWFFSMEDRGIILEDDCVPGDDFFPFASELLVAHEDSNVVGCITGNNFQSGVQRGEASYYFSKYNHCWGWATWRRAWEHYDAEMTMWPDWRESNEWRSLFDDSVEEKYWRHIFDRVYEGSINSWAYPWAASLWYERKVTATPNSNLVTNIGFGESATHTQSPSGRGANKPIGQIETLTHPETIEVDFLADRYTFDYFVGGRDLRFPRRLMLLPWRVVRYIYRLSRGRASLGDLGAWLRDRRF